MSSVRDFIDTIMLESIAAATRLQSIGVIQPFLDLSLGLPEPYLGSGPIRLIIIGQDPTVQREDSRQSVHTVLNLDRHGSLTGYLEDLCQKLGLSLAENVYATNVCKNFFTRPPIAIRRDSGIDVLEASAGVWLPVLKSELAHFPHATILSLGQPVLSMLVRPGFNRTMRYYWGYHKLWRQGEREPLRFISVEASTVDRVIFPFVHEPTQRGRRAEFYRIRRNEYIQFILEQSTR
jgi:uracil-DNA glycosylase